MTGSQSNLEKEINFHDGWAASIRAHEVLVDESFEACTSPENRLIIGKLGQIKNKDILELGCGAGEGSVYFAKKGAHVVATDVSNGMLEVTQKVAKLHNATLRTKQIFADNIDFEDNSFDIVYAANLLHHVDIERTLKEVKRVLRKDGYFIAIDPIAHNPLINIYRKMANKVRTEDEHPIRFEQIKFFKKYFSEVTYHTTWLFTLCIFLKFFFINGVHPNQERYWKKIIVEHKKLEKIYTKLERIDRIVLKFFPILKRYCWNIVIFAKK